MSEIDALLERLERFAERPIEQAAPAIERLAMSEAAATIRRLREALEPVTFCPHCTCDECDRKQEAADIARALGSDEPVQCWSCSCGWIGCYTASDLAEFGEPPECQRCYLERLEPCDPPERARALTRKDLSDGE